MVNRSNQNWEVGQTVKVGFISGLVIVAKCPTPGDFAPDAYALRNGAGNFYRFVPHNGLSRRSSLADAMVA